MKATSLILNRYKRGLNSNEKIRAKEMAKYKEVARYASHPTINKRQHCGDKRTQSCFTALMLCVEIYLGATRR